MASWRPRKTRRTSSANKTKRAQRTEPPTPLASVPEEEGDLLEDLEALLREEPSQRPSLDQRPSNSDTPPATREIRIRLHRLEDLRPPLPTPSEGPRTLEIVSLPDIVQPAPMAWDKGGEVLEAQLAPVAPPIEVTPVQLRGPNGKRRRYNPERHLELADYVSVVDDRDREEEPGPPTSRDVMPTLQRQLSTEIPEPRVDTTPLRRPRTKLEEETETQSKTSEDVNKGGPPRMAGVMFDGLVAIPTDPSVDPPPRTCFNCWGRGHGRRQCPLPERRDLCRNCGRRGVIITTCPRCSEPHRRYLQETFGASSRSRSPTRENRTLQTRRDRRRSPYRSAERDSRRRREVTAEEHRQAPPTVNLRTQGPQRPTGTRSRWDGPGRQNEPMSNSSAPVTSSTAPHSTARALAAPLHSAASSGSPPVSAVANTPDRPSSILAFIQAIQGYPADLQETLLRDAYGRSGPNDQ